MFNSYNNFGAEWFFNTIVLEECNGYNDKDDKLCLKENDNQLYKLFFLTILRFKQMNFERITTVNLTVWSTVHVRNSSGTRVQPNSILLAQSKGFVEGFLNPSH